jgi:hypothetical protein
MGIMKKEHTYVDCHRCRWQLEQQPDHDWVTYPCTRCSNTRRIIYPQEILCNMCGECMCHEIKTLSGLWKTEEPHGLYNAQVSGGYESYHLLDMNTYTFNFCEKCLRQLFIQCKIKPTVDGMDFQDNIREEDCWERDQEIYEYRLWKDDGKHHQAYLNRKCNSEKDCPNKAIYTIMINNDFSEDSCCEEHKREEGGSYSLVPFIPNVLKIFL